MTTPPKRSALLSVIALARAGALDHAWASFSKAGLAAVTDDPRVLTVKGRLLKDRARETERKGEHDAARALFGEAADAYQLAAKLDPATYPLINAATLRLLAGDMAQSRELASDVLDRIAQNPEEPETPFYKLATRAEAQMLLGETDAAIADLREAIQLAPRAWEDHAVTLRQFAMIMAMRGEDIATLDALRPPRSLHFAGHIDLGTDHSEAPLAAEIAAWLQVEKIGFAYGALAAGADIIIAEQVIAHGAELHAVLPGGRRSFAQSSVMQSGGDWQARYDALLDQCETVRTIAPADRSPSDTMIALGNRVAMGNAIMQADHLATSSMQLLVLRAENHRADTPSASVAAGMIWTAQDRAQAVLDTSGKPIVDTPADSPHRPDARVSAQLLTCLGVLVGESDDPAALKQLCGDAEYALPPMWSGDVLILTFNDVATALKLGLRMGEAGWRIGAEIVADAPFDDPFTGTRRLREATLAPLLGTVRSALSGQFNATETLAATALLEAHDLARMEPIGELEEQAGTQPLGLYSVRAL